MDQPLALHLIGGVQLFGHVVDGGRQEDTELHKLDHRRRIQQHRRGRQPEQHIPHHKGGGADPEHRPQRQPAPDTGKQRHGRQLHKSRQGQDRAHQALPRPHLGGNVDHIRIAGVVAALQQRAAHQQHRKGGIFPQQRPQPQHRRGGLLPRLRRRRQRIAEAPHRQDLRRQRRQQHRQDHRGGTPLQHKAQHQRHQGIGGGAGAAAQPVVDGHPPQVELHHHAVEKRRHAHQQHAQHGVGRQQHALPPRAHRHDPRSHQRQHRQGQGDAAAGPAPVGVRHRRQRRLHQQRQQQRQRRDGPQHAVAQSQMQQQHGAKADGGGKADEIAALDDGVMEIHFYRKLVHSGSLIIYGITSFQSITKAKTVKTGGCVLPENGL